MINDKDISNLKWIAKRLVHKHNEDPAIISFINEIISKIEAETLVHQSLSKKLKAPAQDAVTKLNYIINVINDIPAQLQKEQKEILASFHMDSFENLDVEKILGVDQNKRERNA